MSSRRRVRPDEFYLGMPAGGTNAMNYDAILLAKILVERQNAHTCPPIREDERPICTHWTVRFRASLADVLDRLARRIAPQPPRVERGLPTLADRMGH